MEVAERMAKANPVPLHPVRDVIINALVSPALAGMKLFMSRPSMPGYNAKRLLTAFCQDV